MPIDRTTAEMIRLMFSLEDDEQVGVVLKPLAEKIEEYQLLLGPIANGAPIDQATIAVLALSTQHDFTGLEPGEEVFSKRHNRPGTFLRPGPCGWAVCRIEGQVCICNPSNLEISPDKKKVARPPRPRDEKGRLLPASAVAS